ncbi:MAG: RHS repeat-associated core domain-containing protein [Nitrospirae bacterium]|nr:RHS repeat-associated core domain-containing protein [Nitrospirota bacterium]
MIYNSRVGNYTYGTRPHAVTQAGTDAYTYDCNGNMKSGAGRTFTYDYDNRATSIVKAGAATISVYDSSGIRVKKVTPGFTTIYIGKHYECTNRVCSKYIFAGSDRIASIEGADTRYYHTDHLGSSSVITDQSGNQVEDLFYYTSGEIKYNTGSVDVKHKFTGQKFDAENGLYYYGARYYDPRLEKFMTADTIVPEPFNPQALNRYSYCINNPINYTDPSGNSWLSENVSDKVSTVMNDWLGIEEVSGQACYYNVCLQGGLDFTDGQVRPTHAAIGVGSGASVNLRFSSFDLSAGTSDRWAVSVGYSENNGIYASGYGGYGNVSVNGAYYFKHDVYQVGAGVSYNNFAASANYSNYDGWTVGAGYGGVGANYNFDSHETRGSVTIEVDTWIDAYRDGVNTRQYGNGYGPENGNLALNHMIDFLGTVTAGWQAAENHDIAYGKGLNKNAADFELFRGMVGGSISNISHRNGLVRAAVGLAISPLYYGGVAVGGGSSYSAAHP